MQTASVSSRVLWPFVAAFRRVGGDVAEVLQRIGLNEGQLRDPDVRIAYATAAELMETLVHHSGRGDLGLLAAGEVERGHFDLLELAVRSAPTLGEAIEHLVRFFVLLDDGAELALTRGPERSEMRLVGTSGSLVHPAYVEFLPAMLLLAARRETEVATLGAERICFRHSAAAPLQPYEALFRAPVRFEANEDVAVFPTEILALPFLRANPPLQDQAIAVIRGSSGKTCA
jgi:hypothetical protein